MSPAAIAELHEFFLRLRNTITSPTLHQMRLVLTVLLGARNESAYIKNGFYYIPIRGLVGDQS